MSIQYKTAIWCTSPDDPTNRSYPRHSQASARVLVQAGLSTLGHRDIYARSATNSSASTQTPAMLATCKDSATTTSRSIVLARFCSRFWSWKGPSTLVIHNVLYVPDAKVSLLSPSLSIETASLRASTLMACAESDGAKAPSPTGLTLPFFSAHSTPYPS